jgi:hypothetical protein
VAKDGATIFILVEVVDSQTRISGSRSRNHSSLKGWHPKTTLDDHQKQVAQFPTEGEFEAVELSSRP